jgi:hypothetical protein
MHGPAQCTNVRSGDFGAAQELLRAQRCSCRTILLLNAVAAALLPQVLAQQLATERVDQSHVRGIPLHVNPASDPARRRAIVGGLDFDAAVQMHGPLAIEVIAKRLDRQRQQRRFLFGEHGGDLPLGRAVNARVGPALLPVIQIRLRLFQALEALTLQRRFLRVADAGFDLPFPVRISHAARQSDRAVMLQHIAIQRVDLGIVDVRRQHALAQIVEHHHPRGSAQSAKSRLVQLSPDLRAGTEYQQPHGFPAVAQRHHESRVRRYLPLCGSRTIGPVP